MMRALTQSVRARCGSKADMRTVDIVVATFPWHPALAHGQRTAIGTDVDQAREYHLLRKDDECQRAANHSGRTEFWTESNTVQWQQQADLLPVQVCRIESVGRPRRHFDNDKTRTVSTYCRTVPFQPGRA